MEYRAKHATFAAWPSLLAAGSLQTKRFTERGVVLADGQIPPGWKLHFFNLTADGQAYDVLLEDTTDKEQGYAGLTDERGVIRECKALQ